MKTSHLLVAAAFLAIGFAAGMFTTRSDHGGAAASAGNPSSQARSTSDAELKEIVINRLVRHFKEGLPADAPPHPARDRANAAFVFQTIERRQDGTVVVLGLVLGWGDPERDEKFGRRNYAPTNRDRFWMELNPDRDTGTPTATWYMVDHDIKGY